jgi:hypothetical protein
MAARLWVAARGDANQVTSLAVMRGMDLGLEVGRQYWGVVAGGRPPQARLPP